MNPFDEFDTGKNPFDEIEAAPGVRTGEPAPRESADAPVRTVENRPVDQTLGFIKGVMPVIDKLRGVDPLQAIMSRLDPAAAHGLDVQNAIGRQAIPDWEQRATPGKLGQFAGGMAATLPVTATMGPIAGGLATGAMLSEHDSLAGVAGDAALGGVGGKLGDTVMRGLGSVIAPKLAPAVQALLDKGVSLTPGQILGGGFKAAEDKATSIPFVGDMINSARTRGLQDWNRSIYDDVLAPIGQALPKTVKAGNEAFEHVSKTLGQAYDRVIPQTRTEIDDDFVSHLRDTVAPIVQTMTKDAQDQFGNILKQRVLGRFAKGSTPGEVVKEVTSELGTLAGNFSSAADGNQRLLGQAISSVQQGLKDATMRQNPLVAPILQRIDKSYAMLAGLRPAASSTAAEHGVFTPKQLQMASRAGDKTVGKNATAKGLGRYQQAAQIAQDVLPSKVPDSGTAGRAMMAAVPALAAGGAAAVNPMLAMGGLLATLPYTQIGQRVTRGALASRPAVAKNVRGALDSLAHPVSAVTALLASLGQDR